MALRNRLENISADKLYVSALTRVKNSPNQVGNAAVSHLASLIEFLAIDIVILSEIMEIDGKLNNDYDVKQSLDKMLRKIEMCSQ